MKYYTKNTTSGLGIGSVLLIIFVVLKLCNLIKWSWVWVLSPLWISLLIAFVIYIIYFIAVIYAAIKHSKN